MTDAQEQALIQAQAAYIAARKTADAEDLVMAAANAKENTAVKYATSGVLVDLATMRQNAIEAAAKATADRDAEFARAIGAHQLVGSTYQAYQAALADSLTTPGAIENMTGAA